MRYEHVARSREYRVPHLLLHLPQFLSPYQQKHPLEMLALGYGLLDCGLPMKLLERLHPGLWVATQARRRREYTVLTLLPHRPYAQKLQT